MASRLSMSVCSHLLTKTAIQKNNNKKERLNSWHEIFMPYEIN